MAAKPFLSASVLAAMLIGVPAQADATLKYSGTDATQIDVSDGRVRMSQGDGGDAVIYDSATGMITQIDSESRTYMQFSKADAERMSAQVGDQMAAMRKEMEEQLANMPEDQRRALMERLPSMMGGQMDKAAKPRPKPRFTGEKARYGGVACRMATMEVDGVTEDFCLADRDALGISRADFDAIIGLYTTMAQIAEQFPGSEPMPDFEAAGLIPVYSGEEGGTLTEKSTASLDDALFGPPEGYTLRQMPGM